MAPATAIPAGGAIGVAKTAIFPKNDLSGRLTAPVSVTTRAAAPTVRIK
jgi:hypothetical protein